ncbi:MAG: iron ABC transporter permease [Oscillospiraceae bacterium]
MEQSNSQKILRERTVTRLLLLVLFGVILFVAFVLSVGLGAHPLSFSEVLRAIFVETDGVNRRVIWNVRLPRALVGMLAGMCLALAGATLQGVMRNPLAAPNTIGVNAGAGLMATICLILFPQYEYLLTPAAFIGALAATLLIYALSWKDGISPLRMVLAGTAVSSFVSAFINAILIFYPDRVQNTLGFTMGSLAARSWGQFRVILPYALIGLALCLLLAHRMNILMLGDELAQNLGLHVERCRFLFICLAALLAASAVAVVGLLGFVGLMIPHIARLLIGSDYRYLYPASALLGAALVLLCDTIARIVVQPMELPVGVVLAILGAPFFLYLLRGGLRHDD